MFEMKQDLLKNNHQQSKQNLIQQQVHTAIKSATGTNQGDDNNNNTNPK